MAQQQQQQKEEAIGGTVTLPPKVEEIVQGETRTTGQLIGRSMKRKEDPHFLAGRANYVSNVVLPRMLYVNYVRSWTYPHAEIKKINQEKASRCKGVVAVYTGKDVDGKIGFITTAEQLEKTGKGEVNHVPFPVMAVDKVRFQGEIVAAIVAGSLTEAVEAEQALEIEYNPLPGVSSGEEAMKEGAPQIHEKAPNNIAFRFSLKGGDVDKAFSETGVVVVKERLVNQRVIPSAIETRAALVDYDKFSKMLTAWITSQNPFVHRTLLSKMLKLPEEYIRVISPDVGGAFGSKIAVIAPDALTCFIAMQLGRPIKWVETRAENTIGTNHGRDHIEYVELAARKDGTITGLKVESVANIGAYFSTLGSATPTILFIPMVGGGYNIPNISGEVVGVFTNTTFTDQYRGAGRPEASYLIERMVDSLARRLKMDPLDIRRKNLIRQFPHKTATQLVYDSGRYVEVLDRLARKIDYQDFRRKQLEQQKTSDGKLLGIGFSFYIEQNGLGPSKKMGEDGFQAGLWGTSNVKVYPSGKATVFHGGHPQGQGEDTTFAQIAAAELGISPEDVDVRHGDTLITPYGMGTYGSRTTTVEGTAVILSCRKVREKAKRLAAYLLGVSPELIDFKDGKFSIKGGSQEKSKTLKEVSLAAYRAWNLPQGMEPGLEATTFWDPPNFAYSYGLHAALVEIDRETGFVEVKRYVGVDDCGTQVNPMLVEGQLQGGATQAIGQALYEEAVFDAGGKLLTDSFEKYQIPLSVDVPKFEFESIETPQPDNPLGIKGIGEAGAVGGCQAVVNAVLDALSPFNADHIDMPVKPEKIWRIINKREQGS